MFESTEVEEWSVEHPTAIALTDEGLYKEFYKSLSYTQVDECVFCGECPCEHWDGLAFKNPNY